jgi:hypothetical protein
VTQITGVGKLAAYLYSSTSWDEDGTRKGECCIVYWVAVC